MERYLIVDPPMGWMYGFPKTLKKLESDQDCHFAYAEMLESYRDLLKLSKYPEEDMEFALARSRYWATYKKDTDTE